MKIWVVSMECAGIVEAGGVKDVTFSLCENYTKAGTEVTLFIPVFAANSFSALKNINENALEADISICGQTHSIKYTSAEFIEFPAKVVLVNHLAFSEKKAVYVYTEEEQRENPAHIRGNGHSDVHFLDSALSKAVAAYGSLLPGEEMPDVIHCQDASTAITPCYIELMKPDFFCRTRCYVTIHNAGPAYHHEFKNIEEAFYYTELPWNWLQDAVNGTRIEPFLLASRTSVLTTVSTFYADELLEPTNDNITDGLAGIFSARNIKIHGITNGIDYYHYSPEYPEISCLPYSFSPCSQELAGKYKNRSFFLELCMKDIPENRRNCPYLENLFRCGFLEPEKKDFPAVYFVYHGRIVAQKGIKLLIDVMSRMLGKYNNVRFIIMGQGEPLIENSLQEAVRFFEGKIVYFKGYNKIMSRLCITAADFSVLPSDFEPCSLEDFISQMYGTIPLAHATGGLKKIIDGETGFLYEPNTADNLERLLSVAVDFRLKNFQVMEQMIYWASNFVKDVYSWDFVVKEKYLKLFEKNREIRKNNVDSFSGLI